MGRQQMIPKPQVQTQQAANQQMSKRFNDEMVKEMTNIKVPTSAFELYNVFKEYALKNSCMSLEITPYEYRDIFINDITDWSILVFKNILTSMLFAKGEAFYMSASSFGVFYSKLLDINKEIEEIEAPIIEKVKARIELTK